MMEVSIPDVQILDSTILKDIYAFQTRNFQYPTIFRYPKLFKIRAKNFNFRRWIWKNIQNVIQKSQVNSRTSSFMFPFFFVSKPVYDSRYSLDDLFSRECVSGSSWPFSRVERVLKIWVTRKGTSR